MPTVIAKPRKRRSVVFTADQLPQLSPEESARLRALPEGVPTPDAPELDADFWANAKPIHEANPSWPIRPPGRPAAGIKAPATAVVSLRLPKALSIAVRRQARSMHLSFNAAMQVAASSWLSAGQTPQRTPAVPAKRRSHSR
jgi:hypothetical protein